MAGVAGAEGWPGDFVAATASTSETANGKSCCQGLRAEAITRGIAAGDKFVAFSRATSWSSSPSGGSPVRAACACQLSDDVHVMS
jgi:hypothetical protein